MLRRNSLRSSDLAVGDTTDAMNLDLPGFGDESGDATTAFVADGLNLDLPFPLQGVQELGNGQENPFGGGAGIVLGGQLLRFAIQGPRPSQHRRRRI